MLMLMRFLFMGRMAVLVLTVGMRFMGMLMPGLTGMDMGMFMLMMVRMLMVMPMKMCMGYFSMLMRVFMPVMMRMLMIVGMRMFSLHCRLLSTWNDPAF